MRKFAETYLDFLIVQQLVAQFTWGQNIWLWINLKQIKNALGTH